MVFTYTKYTDITTAQARKLAKAAGVKLPRVGYEVNLGDGKWLSSTGHFQFGWFENPGCKFPFVLKERVEDKHPFKIAPEPKMNWLYAY